MCKAVRTDVRISLGLAHRKKGNAAAWSLSDLDDAAPARRYIANTCKMFLSANNGKLFEALLIKRELLREPRQRVSGTLDFEAVYTSVNYSNVNANLGVRQAKLVYHKGIIAAMESAQHLAV